MLTLYKQELGKKDIKIMDGNIFTLSTWAKSKKLTFVKCNKWLFGGYYKDKDGNTYIIL